MVIYGIKNCDKVRHAMKQAQADGHAPTLHDFRVDGIDSELVSAFLQDLTMDELVNKRSTTWKQLSDEQKNPVDVALLVAHPTLIKRPVIQHNQQYRIGL